MSESVRPSGPEIDTVMTNFDHSIKADVAERLRATPNAYAPYTGFNFCGYVWSEGEGWACEVWRYNAPCQVIRRDTLEAIMDDVCAEYGSE